MVVRDEGRWRTLFTGDPEVEEIPSLHALVTAQGDGHAARESQLDLSPQERAALAGEPFYAEGGHFEIVRNPAAHRRLLEILDGPGRESAGR